MAGKDRSLVMPDRADRRRGGLPGFYFYFWHAHLGAEGHAEGRHRQAQRSGGQGGADPATRKRLVTIGQEFFPANMATPEGLAKFQKEEIEKWWPVIKAQNIRVR